MVKIDRKLRMTARSTLMPGMREMHGHLELLLMTVAKTVNEKVHGKAVNFSDFSNSVILSQLLQVGVIIMILKHIPLTECP